MVLILERVSQPACAYDSFQMMMSRSDGSAFADAVRSWRQHLMRSHVAAGIDTFLFMQTTAVSAAS